MPGDADPCDAGFFQDTGLENVQCTGELTDGPRSVAGYQQNILDASGAQFRQCGTQRLRIRDAPHRNVRRRKKPGPLHRERGMNHLCEAGMRRMRHVNGCSGREYGSEFRQSAFFRGCNFGGSATHESDDSAFQVVRRWRRATRLTDIDH